MMRMGPRLRPRLVATNAVLLDVTRQEQHRPVGQREKSEGANPETCRGDEKRHGPIRTEGGRDARDCREGDKDIDQTGEPIRR